MALTKCPDCGKEVSTLAKDCPGCGRPVVTFSANEPESTPTVTKKSSNKLKNSDQVWIMAFIFAGAMAGGLYYFFPDLPWWVYVLVFLMAGGVANSEGLKDKANEVIADSDKDKDK